jgi:hypothetical protein
VGLGDAIAKLFSFLGTETGRSKRIREYVIREHRSGRPLADILADHYVTNRCSPEEIDRLLDDPELVHALGDDVVESFRSAG